MLVLLVGSETADSDRFRFPKMPDSMSCLSGCLSGLGLLNRPRGPCHPMPDCSCQPSPNWGPSPEVDLVPSRDRPRVGSWASPVPSMPAPWGTWEMEINETPNRHYGDRSSKLVMKVEVKPKGSQGPQGKAKAKMNETETFSAQPGRLEEIGISRTNSPSSFMVEQLLSSPGSLPQGLTQSESERLMEKRVDQARRRVGSIQLLSCFPFHQIMIDYVGSSCRGLGFIIPSLEIALQLPALSPKAMWGRCVCLKKNCLSPLRRLAETAYA